MNDLRKNIVKLIVITTLTACGGSEPTNTTTTNEIKDTTQYCIAYNSGNGNWSGEGCEVNQYSLYLEFRFKGELSAATSTISSDASLQFGTAIDIEGQSVRVSLIQETGSRIVYPPSSVLRETTIYVIAQ